MKCIARKGFIAFGGKVCVNTNKSNRIRVGEEFHYSYSVMKVLEETKDPDSPGRYLATAEFPGPREITRADIPNVTCRCKKFLESYLEFTEKRNESRAATEADKGAPAGG